MTEPNQSDDAIQTSDVSMEPKGASVAAIVAGSITANEIAAGSIALARLGPTDANPNHPAPSEPGELAQTAAKAGKSGKAGKATKADARPARVTVLLTTSRFTDAEGYSLRRGRPVSIPETEVDRLLLKGKIRLAGKGEVERALKAWPLVELY